jgi:hypothetical protein
MKRGKKQAKESTTLQRVSTFSRYLETRGSGGSEGVKRRAFSQSATVIPDLPTPYSVLPMPTSHSFPQSQSLD